MSEKNPNKINLDQLLDLKRSEKPASPEFWDGFQSEFRQRQLQTLVKKDSPLGRLGRVIFSKPGFFVPVSGTAIALFALVLNLQESEPSPKQSHESANSVKTASQSLFAQVALELPDIEVVHQSSGSDADSTTDPGAASSFIMDLIPNEEPESLSYTREFPTFTIPADNRVVSTLVSYTLAHDASTFGFSGRPQTIGF